MSIKDKYNKKPSDIPKSKSSEIMRQMINSENQQTVNTEIQNTVFTENKVVPERSVKKATFLLDADLHKRLRTAAALNDTTMVEIVEKAINEYLDRIDT